MKFKKTLSIFLASCFILGGQTIAFAKTNSVNNTNLPEKSTGKLISKSENKYVYEVKNSNGKTEKITVDLDKNLVVNGNETSKVSDYVKDSKTLTESSDILLVEKSLTSNPLVKTEKNSLMQTAGSGVWYAGVQGLQRNTSILLALTTTAIATAASALTKGDYTKMQDLMRQLTINLGNSYIGKIVQVYYTISQWYQPDNYMYTEEMRDYYSDSSFVNYAYSATWYFYGSKPY